MRTKYLLLVFGVSTLLGSVNCLYAQRQTPVVRLAPQPSPDRSDVRRTPMPSVDLSVPRPLPKLSQTEASLLLAARPARIKLGAVIQEPVNNSIRSVSAVSLEQELVSEPLVPEPLSHTSGFDQCNSCGLHHDGACSSQSRGWFSRKYHCEIKPRMQATHWGYPEYFCERPFGSYMQMALSSQIRNGTAARMMLYQYDFHHHRSSVPSKLNSRGMVQLRKIARLMIQHDLPVLIEAVPGGDRLTAARKEEVLVQLRILTGDVPDERVVISAPRFLPLDSADGSSIHRNQKRDFSSGGSSLPSSGGSIGGGSGGSSSGGGSRR